MSPSTSGAPSGWSSVAANGGEKPRPRNVVVLMVDVKPS